MAESPAHKFGQIIGDTLEVALEPLLQGFAKKHGLYLDKRGPRPARDGNKVSWTDLYGNKHDLDFVLEKNGSNEKIGEPIAFIETAWRRYTKHSRNKAQEIQGTILPLVETHQYLAPFIGVILAGVFTEGALAQLRSLGFTVLYFPYEGIRRAFFAVGIDVHFDEETPDAELVRKVSKWESLPKKQHIHVAKKLIKINSKAVNQFMNSLEHSITRHIELIRVLPLHGIPLECNSIEEAIEIIKNYDENSGSKPVVKYEVEIRYNNGDRITGQFAEKDDLVRFLRTSQSPPFQPA